MPKTSQVLTSPLAGIVVAPIHDYTEQQEAQIKDLREVRSVWLGVTQTALMDLES